MIRCRPLPIDALVIRLEFARTEDAGDPYAFHTGPQDYLLRWPDGAFEPARLVWNDELLQQLAAVRHGQRDPELARRLGGLLQRFLAPTRFAGLSAQLRAAVAAGRPARLEILAAAAELYTLPWELLTQDDGRTLGELPNLEIHHAWPGAVATPAAAPREGGRVLLAWSQAFGNVGAAHSEHALAAACHAGFVGFERERDVLRDASLAGLVAHLERRLAEPDPPTVLHLLAHGAPDGPRYGLGLDDGRGGREVVDAAALRRALAPFADRIRLVVLMACDSGNPGPPGAHLGSAVQELHRAGFAAVIGSRYPLTGAGALEFTRTFYHDLLQETASVDTAFTAARVRLARGPGLDWVSLQLYRPHADPPLRPIVFRPHRGLLAFEREHARFFFGRDPERREALADLQALVAAAKPRLLVVAGASGTGKSSVVLAALVPEVIALGWSTLVLRPGSAPCTALDDGLARQGGDTRPLLLVVDQFEEVFTHADASERRGFARRLWDLSRSPDGLTRVVLTLRVDYLGRCGELELDDAGTRLDLIAYDEAHRVFVAQMAADRLAETITGPVARLGLTLEPGLPARLLQEVGHDPVGLPLLQYALDQLWQRRSGDTLTHAALDAIGGVHGALARHADAAVDRLAPPEQDAARRLLVRLVVFGADPSSGARRRVLLGSLRPEPPGPFERAVAALIAARLLVRRSDEGGEAHATLEVAHEALIRHWDRLWRWYEEARANLTRGAELDAIVDQAREHRELLTGNRLVHAEALARALGPDLDTNTRDFLRTSRATTDRTHHTRRVVLGLAWAGMLLAITLVAYFALDARRQARRAQDSAAIATATAELDAHPHIAAALLGAVHDVASPRWRESAYVAAQTALPSALLELAAPPITAAATSPDGKDLISGHEDGSVRVWPLAPGEDATVLRLDPGVAGSFLPIRQLLVQPASAGYTVLAARDDHVQVWQQDPGGARLLTAAAIVSGPGDPPATLPKIFHRSPTSGRIALLEDHGPIRAFGPDGAALGERDGCPWLSGEGEQLLCGSGDALTLRPWTGEGELAAFTKSDWTDQPLGPAAALIAHRRVFNVDATTVIADPDSRRLLVLNDAHTPILLPDRVVWESGSSELCERPRAADRPARCAALPADCRPTDLFLRDDLRGVHPNLGALLHCRGAQARAIFAELGPYDPLISPTLAVRHEILLPDSPAAALLLTADPDRLVVVARDAQIWQWDLDRLPSGFLTGRVSGYAALVPGSLAVVDPQPSATAELQHLRWDTPAGPPTRTRHALPPDLATPLRPVAHATGYVAAYRPWDLLIPPREYQGGPPRERDGMLFTGDFSLAPPRRQDLVLSHVAGVFASTPDAATLVISTGSTVDLVERASPDTPRLRIPAPIDTHREDRPLHYLVQVAVHPRGSATVVQWSDHSVVVGDPAAATVAPLRPPGPARCGDTNPASEPPSALAYAPDGRWLAVGRRFGRLELFPLTPAGLPDPAATTAVMCRPGAAVTAIAFSPDAATVVSGDDAGGLAIWTDITPADTASTTPIAVSIPGRPPIVDVTLAGEHVLALTDDGRLWFTPAVATTPALRARLASLARVCPAEPGGLLGEPEGACPGRRVLRERAP